MLHRQAIYGSNHSGLEKPLPSAPILKCSSMRHGPCRGRVIKAYPENLGAVRRGVLPHAAPSGPAAAGSSVHGGTCVYPDVVVFVDDWLHNVRSSIHN